MRIVGVIAVYETEQRLIICHHIHAVDGQLVIHGNGIVLRRRQQERLQRYGHADKFTLCDCNRYGCCAFCVPGADLCDLIHAGERIARLFLDQLAELCQLELAAAAVEERNVQLVFQTPNGAADALCTDV